MKKDMNKLEKTLNKTLLDVFLFMLAIELNKKLTG